MKRRSLPVLTLLVPLSLIVPCWADIIVPGADGSDGAFSPASNITINLANSPNGAWDGPNPDPNTPLTGVYDENKWAVVFRFSSVNIPTGVTVTFINHPSRAPVVWLVSGTVVVSGTISLDGSNGHPVGGPFSQAEPGPGGYRGGRGGASNSANSGGFGPGGGRNSTTVCNVGGGSYGTAGTDTNSSSSSAFVGPTYGNPGILPLRGGSGGCGFPVGVAACSGAGNPPSYSGAGAGGGAMLVAASQVIQLSAGSLIRANGGNAGSGSNHAGGSGGAIRLIADIVTGSGLLQAVGGNQPNSFHRGGAGRIRVERNSGSLVDGGNPAYSAGPPGSIATIWPSASAPTITAALIGGQTIPGAPLASLDFPNADVALTNPNPVVVQLQCANVPTNSTVMVRIVPKSGQDFSVPATFVSGDTSNSIWQTAASGPNAISLPDGFCAIQARAVLP